MYNVLKNNKNLVNIENVKYFKNIPGGDMPKAAGFYKDRGRSLEQPLILLQSVKGFWEELDQKI